MSPNKIIIHHSLTKDSDTVSWGAIRNYHKSIGWNDIGYHFGIEKLRGQSEILVGRMPDQIGAHCRRNNSDSIGICFIGNFDIQIPTVESWNLGVDLCKYLVRAFGIKDIAGHRDFNKNKTCPGKLFNMTRFRRDVFF